MQRIENMFSLEVMNQIEKYLRTRSCVDTQAHYLYAKLRDITIDLTQYPGLQEELPNTDELRVDDRTLYSLSGDGVWVGCWVFVSEQDIATKPSADKATSLPIQTEPRSESTKTELVDYTRRYIRVLTLQSYMRLVATKLDHRSIAERLRDVDVVYGREGLYLNRDTKSAWWEYEGKAYTHEGLYDQATWELKNTIERPLERAEMHQLKSLSKHRRLGERVEWLIQRSEHWWLLHDMRRQGGLLRLQIMRLSAHVRTD